MSSRESHSKTQRETIGAFPSFPILSVPFFFLISVPTLSFYRYGLECLFRFYSYGLEKKFRKDLFDEFQKYTLEDYHKNHLYGLEKFWAYLRYRPDQKSNPLEILPELQQILTQYKSLDDFKVQDASGRRPSVCFSSLSSF